jgi:creatinine amidohydrolase
VKHACEAETSMMMVLAPGSVRAERIEAAIPPGGPVAGTGVPSGVARARSFKSFAPTGVIGDPRAATADKGEALIAAAGAGLSALLADPAFWA